MSGYSKNRRFAGMSLWGLLLWSAFPASLPAWQFLVPGTATGGDTTFRSAVDVVTLSVSVTDKEYRSFSGLEKQDFSVYEDGVLQKLTAVNQVDNPVSVGLVFDASGSMADTIELCKQVVREFFQLAHPEDEYFLIEFANRPMILSGFTRQIKTIIDYVGAARGGGRTALYDGVYLAVAEMRKARHRRRILLLLSDGDDNFSTYNERDIRDVLGDKEVEIPIYTIGVFNSMSGNPWAGRGADNLAKLSKMSGGRSFEVTGPDRLFEMARKISKELRTQYEIAYTPSNQKHDGQWRGVRVQLNQPPGGPKLQATTRPGYLAPVSP